MKILITLGATLFFGVAFSQKPLTENTYTIDSTFEKGSSAFADKKKQYCFGESFDLIYPQYVVLAQ